MAFIYYDFAKENKYVQLTMDGKDYVYQIFAAGFIDGYSYNTLPINEYNDNEKKEYLETMMKKEQNILRPSVSWDLAAAVQ